MENGIWWDKSIKVVEGCTKVSAGCENCWSLAMEHRFGNGFSVHVDRMQKALKRKRPTTFTIWNDLFHEGVTDAQIDEVMAVIAMTPQHKYMILTKRPERMKEYFDFTTDNRNHAIQNAILQLTWDCPDWIEGPLPNLALGVSIEDQQTAHERIPLLLMTPAYRRFVSFEPALDMVSFRWMAGLYHKPYTGQNPNGITNQYEALKNIDLIIMGGESGPKARPMHPDWARSVRDQCAEANVPFNFKQWGLWIWMQAYNEVGNLLIESTSKDGFFEKLPKGCKQDRLLDGVEHNGEIIW